jgi:ATP-dependent Clp protease adapter protein ClpS
MMLSDVKKPNESVIVEDIFIEKLKDIAKPTEYAVLLNNNPVTPFQSVIMLLMDVFSMSERESQAVMIEAHKKGYSVCLISSKEICEFKKKEAEDYCSFMQYECPFIFPGISSRFDALTFEVKNIDEL